MSNRAGWCCFVGMLAIAGPSLAPAEPIKRLIVDITTADVRFAGTDDPMKLSIGGFSFPLDNPSRDDFERGNTDRFELTLPGPGLDIEVLRQLDPLLSVIKTQDSFFGGGWKFGAITIRPHDDQSAPIYQNANVNDWLEDSPDNVWSASLDDPGWSLPEPPPPWPACTYTYPELGTVPDSDCDGIPDDSDDQFDRPQDSDGDGLPDLYEQQNGLDAADADSDDDGWADGRSNVRSLLVLTNVEVNDNDDWFGNDELYVVAEDVVYPVDLSLDGYWSIESGSNLPVNQIVDSRVSVASPPPDGRYNSRMLLRSKDWQPLEWLSQWPPTDRTFMRDNVRWPTPAPVTLSAQSGSFELTFRTIQVRFADPTPGGADGPIADVDGDDLGEVLEAAISRQQFNVANPLPAVAGYDGLADPEFIELFVEIDHSGGGYAMSGEIVQDIASQYAYHDIRPRIDNGYLGGGGQDVGYQQAWSRDQVFTARTGNMHVARCDFVRYVLSVDEHADGRNGQAACGGGDNTSPCSLAFTARQTRIADFGQIVLFHELGHTLKLCHPLGKDTDRPPHPHPTCPAPAGWGSDSAKQCSYCGVADEDPTAMGNDIDYSVIIVVAAIAAAIGIGIGVLVGILTGGVLAGIFAGIGAALGASLIGALIGSQFSDPIEREVNYHASEWARVDFYRTTRGLPDPARTECPGFLVINP